MRTWKIIELGIVPVGKIGLCCPHCGIDAEMPIATTKSPVIASLGLDLIFDDPNYNPDDILPKRIKCRYCRSIYEQKGGQ